MNTSKFLFNTIRLSAMANVPTELRVLHASTSISRLVPPVLLLVLFILLTSLYILVAIRLISSTRQVAELVYQNASLQRSIDARKTALTIPAEDSGSGRIASDTKDTLEAGYPSGQYSAPSLPGDAESERVVALEARLDFLRESCRVMFAQKNDLLTQRNVDLATLETQLAVTHQTKNALLAEKDASCKLIIAEKNEELATLKAQLAAVQQSIATITTDRDEAHARVATIADALEKTHAEYGESLKTRAIDVERNSASLQATIQQQTTEIGDIVRKNDNLSAELTKVRQLYDSDLERFRIQESNHSKTIADQRVEIAVLTARLTPATRPRATPASPRYSLQSILSRRSNESEPESDSSFDSDRPSPPRWHRLVIRLPRKATKP